MRNFKLFYLIGLLSIVFNYNSAKAQLITGNATFVNNKLKGVLSSSGNHFSSNSSPGLYLDAARKLISASSIWLSAKDQNGNLRTAGSLGRETVNQNYDLWPGPIDLATQFGANYTLWDVVWGVSRFDINNHIQNWNQLGYITPESILNWPGTGYGNLPVNTAPFQDINGNQIYEPLQGEYPLVKGDVAYYSIFNDNFNTHTKFNGLPLGFEIRCLTYYFSSSSEEFLKNSIFMDYEIYNRSPRNYDSLYVGIWNDFDIGGGGDDFIGTDVNRNMFYAYNGDNMDLTGISGFGATPPAIGTIFLNSSLDKSMYFYNSSGTELPTTGVELNNYLTGYWSDGTRLTFGGTGYDPASTNFANYVFPDTTGGNSQQWSQISESSIPGDVKIMGSNGPTPLNSNSFLKFKIAYLVSRDLNGNNLSSLEKLKTQADSLNAFYQSNLSSGLLNLTSTDRNNLSVYPNPNDGNFSIQLKNPKAESYTLKVTDITGKVLLEKKSITNFPFSVNELNLPNGVYSISLVSSSQYITQKLTIAK